jgi:hypothetical protein
MDQNEHPLEPHHLGVPSISSKMIPEPMACLAQTVHLSCTTLTPPPNGPKPRVHPKQFSSLWYIRYKPCTHLASRLALSPNGPKRASIWASSPRSTIGSVQNDFLSLRYVWRKSCIYLALALTQSLNGPKWDSTRATSSRSSIGCSERVSKPMVCSVQTVYLSCIKLSTISKWTKMSFHLSLII